MLLPLVVGIMTFKIAQFRYKHKPMEILLTNAEYCLRYDPIQKSLKNNFKSLKTNRFLSYLHFKDLTAS